MDYLIALGNAISPCTPPSECVINVRFCFVYYIIVVMFFEAGGGGGFEISIFKKRWPTETLLRYGAGQTL